MERIKRTEVKTHSGIGTLFKAILIGVICVALITIGYVTAAYFLS